MVIKKTQDCCLKQILIKSHASYCGTLQSSVLSLAVSFPTSDLLLSLTVTQLFLLCHKDDRSRLYLIGGNFEKNLYVFIKSHEF